MSTMLRSFFCGSPSGAAESSRPFGRLLDRSANEWQRLVSMEHHLGDSLAVLDSDRLSCGIPHDHPPLVRKIRIHRSRRIRDREPLLEGGAATWPNLRFVSNGQPRLEAERHERHGAGGELETPSFA